MWDLSCQGRRRVDPRCFKFEIPIGVVKLRKLQEAMTTMGDMSGHSRGDVVVKKP